MSAGPRPAARPRSATRSSRPSGAGGYATETSAALVEWAFAHTGVVCVTAQADPANLASVRVLEKVGFVPDGEGDEGCVRFVLWERNL